MKINIKADYKFNETKELILHGVNKQLGTGFLEPVYQEALALEFANQDIPFERERELLIKYKGTTLNKKYLADFVCFNKILLELKAVKQLLSEHEAQLLNYLKATGLKLGILINFSGPKLYYKRFVI